MARSFLVLDIETVPDPDLAWDAAVDGFPPAPFHQVVALGVLWLDGEHAFRKLGAFGGDREGPPDEAKVLEEFADFIGERHPTMVSFNGRRFDLPVLANRIDAINREGGLLELALADVEREPLPHNLTVRPDPGTTSSSPQTGSRLRSPKKTCR